MSDLTPSPACCRTAPPSAPVYKQEGLFVQENGTKTYETGSEYPTHAVLYIYDIFGLYPQTLRGADILATSIAKKTGSPTKVFMPDWFTEPADISMYPPDTPEKMEYIQNFFSVNAAPNAIIPQIDGLMKSMTEKNPTIKSWVIVGFCWGGKVLIYLFYFNLSLHFFCRMAR
jgi:dienelactone hydrolase